MSHFLRFAKHIGNLFRTRDRLNPLQRFTVAFLFSLIGFAFSELQIANGCPNCPIGLISYSDHIAKSDAVVLAEWSGATAATDDQPGSTSLQIRQIVKGDDKRLAGQKLKVDRFRAGMKGDLFLLFATIDEETSRLVWNDVEEVNAASFQYILKAPPMEVVAAKRLNYFMKFLEFPDNLVANDAFAEFARADYKTLVEMAPELPRVKICEWILNPETPAIRLGLYGTLLGLCGNRSDAKVLETRIAKQEGVGAYRLGLEGLISGYLMLEGEAGLKFIDSKILQNTSTSFSDVFAAAQALRFMWTYSDKISHARLCQSMEGLLTRTEITDIVIADLARWKDWSAMDRLVKIYGQGEAISIATRRAVIRYLVACSRQHPGTDKQAATVAEQKKKADVYLEQIRRIDPKIVADTERFFEGR